MFAFFVLGREPRLSIAEIAAVYGPKIKSYPLVSEELLIAEMENFDAAEAAEKLGGSTKYGRIEKFDDTDEQTMKALTANRILAHVTKQRAENAEKSRVTFSISGYNNIVGKQFGFGVKSLLTKEGYSARMATSGDPNMSAAAVTKARLLTKGCDVVVTHQGRTAWIGITESVQPFEAQSHRDFDRPNRDQFRGMIPVQLARTLVNIAVASAQTSKSPQISPDFTLLDPFCGQGTILMEAALLGIPNVLGADIDAKAVEETQGNIKWLAAQNSGFPNPSALEKIIQVETRDARETPQSPRLDAVVTEPFLGTPVTGPLTQNDIFRRQKELAPLYAAAIRKAANALKLGGILIMTLPAYRFINKFNAFPKQDLLPASMEAVSPMGPELEMKAGETKTENIIYKRADQFVGREILIARKK